MGYSEQYCLDVKDVLLSKMPSSYRICLEVDTLLSKFSLNGEGGSLSDSLGWRKKSNNFSPPSKKILFSFFL